MKKQNFEEYFKKLNPNSTIPIILDGNTVVLGDTNSLFFYVVKKFKNVKELLYSEE